MSDLPNRRIVQNAVYLPEPDVYLVSRDRHDFCAHTWVDKQGVKRTYHVDGGTAYLKRGGDLDEVEAIDWCIHSDDPFEVYRDKLLWGTRGVKGDQPLRWVLLKDCSLRHLRAIQRTQPQIVGTEVERVVDWWVREGEGS